MYFPIIVDYSSKKSSQVNLHYKDYSRFYTCILTYYIYIYILNVNKFQVLILSILFIAYRTNLARRLVCDVEVITWFAFSRLKMRIKVCRAVLFKKIPCLEFIVIRIWLL